MVTELYGFVINNKNRIVLFNKYNTMEIAA